MEDTRFDTMAKALGSLASRRLTLSALLGGAFGVRALMDAEARRQSGKCRPKCGECQRCQKGDCDKKNGKKRCKKGKCQPKQNGTACSVTSGGATCQGGVCSCCGGICKDLQTDPANCGTCGTSCPATRACVAGRCCGPRATPCTSGLECCNNLCLPGNMSIPFPHCA